MGLSQSDTSNDPDFYFILVLGDSRVGKSSFVKRIQEDIFTQYHDNSIYRVEECTKIINGKQIKLKFVEIHESYENIFSFLSSFKYHLRGAIILFDITLPNSISNLPLQIQRIREGFNGIIMLLQNKIDQVENEACFEFRKVVNDKVRGLALEQKLLYTEISVKQNQNIDLCLNLFITSNYFFIIIFGINSMEALEYNLDQVEYKVTSNCFIKQYIKNKIKNHYEKLIINQSTQPNTNQ